MSLLTMLLALAAGVAVSDNNAEFAPVERNEQGFLVHEVESSLQSQPTQIRVLLPDQMRAGQRYPALFVLPVEAGDGHRYGDGLAECKSHDLHNKHSIICVTPTFSGLPWYADHPSDSGIQQETYFLNVVVPFVDKTYPTIAKREGRLLVGFSKSGWGAFSLILRHPDIFEKAAAWDAPLMKEKPDQFGMGSIFGTQENFEQYQISRLVEQQASQFRGESRLIHLGFGNFRDHHERAESLMKKLEVGHEYREGPHREHLWSSGWLPEAVEMLTRTGR